MTRYCNIQRIIVCTCRPWMLIPFKLVVWYICRFTTQQRASNCLYTSTDMKMIRGVVLSNTHVQLILVFLLLLLSPLLLLFSLLSLLSLLSLSSQ